MKIYTKTGDAGETGVFGGPRVAKDDPRIEAYGAVDELNAALGLVRSTALPATIEELLAAVQNDLFALGAELATPDPVRAASGPKIEAARIAAIEHAIDEREATLPALAEFILPGGTFAAAMLHVARTICRRAERRTVSLARAAGASVRSEAIVYLNRLGDLLFVLARAVNASAAMPDTPWKKP
jgi:cob(I)alamin adenosyltransferase